MEKISGFLSIMTLSFLIVGCQTAQEANESSNEEPIEENELEEENDHSNGTSESSDPSEETPTSEEEKEPRSFLLAAQHIQVETEDQVEFTAAFSFERVEEELSMNESLTKSLIEADLSEQDILDTYVDIEVEGSELHLYFNEDDNNLAATSAQSRMFFDSLFAISDMFGMSEVFFYNPDGELDITVADENGEPLSFQATIETMKTIDGESGGHSLAIIEGIEVKEATFENGIAMVDYTVHEEEVSEADQIVFERAMQLTALDFHADELHLMNETTQVKLILPLLNESISID